MWLLTLGCQDVKTIWSMEVRSPDGHWLAIAKTVQHFGPGTAGIQTIVYLKSNSDDPTQILLLSHNGDDQSPLINLTMKWISPTHLYVAYTGHPTLDVQTVKFGGIDISVQNLSNAKGIS